MRLLFSTKIVTTLAGQLAAFIWVGWGEGKMIVEGSCLFTMKDRQSMGRWVSFQVNIAYRLVMVARWFSDGADPFVYTRAVVCGGVASTLPAAAVRLESSRPKVDLEKARKQQREYVEVIALHNTVPLFQPPCGV